MSEVRKIAVKSLQDIIEKKVFLSDIKNEISSLSDKDMAFFNMLLLTTLRNFVFAKKIIKKFSTNKIARKHSLAEYALILAICEILYLRTPEYAVINSYVDIVKKSINKFMGGFINAVLRKVCANKDELLSSYQGEFFSQNFLEILKKDYDSKTIKEIEKSAINEPPLDITAKSNPEIWASKLSAKTLPNGSIRLEGKSNIESLEGFESGDWWVQDFAASLAVQTLEDLKDKKVLDICAAPGGKSAQLISAGAKTTCLDISEQRLKTLEDNLTRLNLKAEDIICEDGIEYLKNFSGEKFDAILLDAPCSATGTIRRHPEIVHIKTIDDINKQAELQKEFLRHVKNALKKDGILVYCTCSISKIEGEQQIVSFLNENKDFKLIPIKEKETNLCQNGMIRTLPCHMKDIGGMDSFFVAKLQKVS